MGKSSAPHWVGGEVFLEGDASFRGQLLGNYLVQEGMKRNSEVWPSTLVEREVFLTRVGPLESGL